MFYLQESCRKGNLELLVTVDVQRVFRDGKGDVATDVSCDVILVIFFKVVAILPADVWHELCERTFSGYCRQAVARVAQAFQPVFSRIEYYSPD